MNEYSFTYQRLCLSVKKKYKKQQIENNFYSILFQYIMKIFVTTVKDNEIKEEIFLLNTINEYSFNAYS